MTQAFHFRPLTNSWLTDHRVRESVDALVRKTFPEEISGDFEWHEIPIYIDAWQAAQQTVAEWTRDVFDLWDAVWGYALDGSPAYVQRHGSTANLSDGGIRELWFDGWNGRHIHFEGIQIQPAIIADHNEIGLQIEFEQKVPKFNYRDWAIDGAEMDSPLTPILKHDDQATINLEPLRATACEILASLRERAP